jgi:hypothetical protein
MIVTSLFDALGVLMTIDPFGTESIERYLRTRGRRYFRGQHDGDYFFVLSVDNQRLHVHLEVTHEDPFTIRVVPAYFFPSADRGHLLAFVERWNKDNSSVKAVVHESCDPTRVGVVAEKSYRCQGITFEEFQSSVDQTIQSAVRLFGELTPAATATRASTLNPLVLDAG